MDTTETEEIDESPNIIEPEEISMDRMDDPNIIEPEESSMDRMDGPNVIEPEESSMDRMDGPNVIEPEETSTDGPIITPSQENRMTNNPRQVTITTPPVGMTNNPLQGQITTPPNPKCPPGLEKLIQIDTLLVHKVFEMPQMVTGSCTINNYTVTNSRGQTVFIAEEGNDVCTRMFCGAIRHFDMSIFSDLQQEAIRLYRPVACQLSCCPFFRQTLEVSSPPGTVIGKIEQEWSILFPEFKILDAGGNVVLRIKGPGLTFSFFGLNNVEFKILCPDATTEIGQICKTWGGLAKELCTDADSFILTFPMDLDVKMKAVMLGACFLIDFMFFTSWI